MLTSSGIASIEKQRHTLRVVDKLQKIGEKDVRLELAGGRMDASGSRVPGVGLEAKSIDMLLDLIAVTGGTRGEVVENAASKLPTDEICTAALKEMRELDAALTSLGVSEQDAIFDVSLARGLAYYTGPIFEAYLADAPDIGAVIGGGRYDNLVDRFLEHSIPAVGASFGLDRFSAALRRLKLMDSSPTLTQAMIISFPGVPSPYLLKVASMLRREGIRTEVYFGEPNAKMKDQLSLANLRQVPVAVIIGPDEMEKEQASVKDLQAGLQARTNIGDREEFRKQGKTGQVTVPLSDLVSTVKNILG